MKRAPRKKPNHYERNYSRLERLLGQPLAELQAEQDYRLSAPGFMDLVVEVLPACEATGGMVLSLAHYFELNEDLCQDPEMTVRVFHPGMSVFQELAPSTDPRRGRVEALTFRQALPDVYQEIYPAPRTYRPQLRRSLNTFLTRWLRHLEEQGHRRVEPESCSAA